MITKTKYLDICQFSGYGHYKIGIMIRNKMYTTITTDMPSIDDYHSDEYEKDGRELKQKRGFKCLYNQIKRDNKIYEYKN